MENVTQSRCIHCKEPIAKTSRKAYSTGDKPCAKCGKVSYAMQQPEYLRILKTPKKLTVINEEE